MAPRTIWAFASGSNSPGEIVGFARAGIPPGVAMLRLDRDTGRYKWACGFQGATTWAPAACWLALSRTARELRIPVFVDTGAYTEFKAPRPIPPHLWDSILADQLALAKDLGPLAVLVLPDKVGDQAATLRRLRKYRKQVRAILDTGAHGIVAIQGGGSRSGVEFAKEVAKILGRKDWVLGFPTVVARRTPQEIWETLAQLPWRPRGAHLLGIGPAGDEWGAYTAALAPLPANAWASSDTVIVRRLVGRPHVTESGREYKLGPLTEQEDIAREELLEEAWGGVWDPLVGVMIDPTEQLPDPSGWMPKGISRAIGRAGKAAGYLTAEEARVFGEDPTAGRLMVQERDEHGAEWWLDYEIEKAWWQRLQVHREAIGWQMRKERARRAYFGERPPTPETVPEYGQMLLIDPAQL